MAKNLQFGGKGKIIVNNTRVKHKLTKDIGNVIDMKFNSCSVAIKFRVKWDAGFASWVCCKDIDTY
jgi:hypothetical protein